MKDYRSEWKGWDNLPQHKEGHTGKYPIYQQALFNIVKNHQPKNILEIGFNAGHSACCFLNAAPNTKMITFDICRWGTEYPALAVLKEFFDIELIEGDSLLTVPKWSKENTVKFDFIFVDGAHFGEHPYKDMINCLELVAIDGLILIDDMHIPDVFYAHQKINWSNFSPISVPSTEKKFKVYKRIK